MKSIASLLLLTIPLISFSQIGKVHVQKSLPPSYKIVYSDTQTVIPDSQIVSISGTGYLDDFTIFIENMRGDLLYSRSIYDQDSVQFGIPGPPGEYAVTFRGWDINQTFWIRKH